MRCLNGGWSYSWQGDKADEHAGQYNTILEAFTNKFGAENIIYEAGVTYKQGGNWWEENTPEIEKAVAAAAAADYIVACIGENSYCETPGNLTNLTLSQNQLDLVKALAKTGKPIVLILNEGRPRLIADIEPLAKAVVNTMLPGNYGWAMRWKPHCRRRQLQRKDAFHLSERNQLTDYVRLQTVRTHRQADGRCL